MISEESELATGGDRGNKVEMDKDSDKYIMEVINLKRRLKHGAPARLPNDFLGAFNGLT